MRSTVSEFFAHQLKTDPDYFSQVVDALSYISGKKNVLEKFYEENQEKVRKILGHLKLTYPTAEELTNSTDNCLSFWMNPFVLMTKAVPI
jgi:hypothetical protein